MQAWRKYYSMTKAMSKVPELNFARPDCRVSMQEQKAFSASEFFRRPYQKKISILTFLFLFIILTACQKERSKGFFNTYIQSDPARLDPFYSTDVVSGRILAHLFNGLFKIDKQGKCQKDLLYDYSFDGKLLKAELRRDIFFHNGRKLTSKDVVFSFIRIMNSSNPTSPRKWVFRNIKTINTAGDYKFFIRLRKPSSTLLYLLTMPNCYIISEEAYNSKGEILGTGPFMLSEWKRDDRIVLVKNTRYFSDKPRVSGIIYKIIPEDLTARFEFLNKTIDYFELPYLANINLNKYRIMLMDAPELSVHYIALNTSRYPFNDRLFRKALNMAIDRNTIMKSLFKNRFVKAAGPVPPVIGDYRSIKDSILYNPSEAGKIIERTGNKGKELILCLKADHQVSLICQMIQHFLNKAGLNVKIREMEWSALKAAALKGEYDMAYFSWFADYPEAENFLYPLFFSGNRGAGGNRSYYANKEVDRLLIEAREIVDNGKRFAVYQQIERIILDDAPWIFLWYGDKRIALSGRVKMFVPYPIYNGMKGNEIDLWH